MVPSSGTDKQPMLADLRESGCLPADTRILRADTGAEVTLGELLAQGARDIPVWSLDERPASYVPRTMTHVFPSGVKESSDCGSRPGGRSRPPPTTRSSPTRLATLGELSGSRIAVARHVPAPLRIVERG